MSALTSRALITLGWCKQLVVKQLLFYKILLLQTFLVVQIYAQKNATSAVVQSPDTFRGNQQTL